MQIVVVAETVVDPWSPLGLSRGGCCVVMREVMKGLLRNVNIEHDVNGQVGYFFSRCGAYIGYLLVEVIELLSDLLYPFLLFLQQG